MIILKIGGSILTEKDSAKPEVDYESLERIAGEIEKALYSDEMSNDLVDGLIIVHGAGSFGHPPAKKRSSMEFLVLECLLPQPCQCTTRGYTISTLTC